MTTLTLLIKASNFGQVKKVDEMLKAQFEELDVEVKVTSNITNRWIQVALTGEDEAIATSYIKKEIGLCPLNLQSAKDAQVLRGYISKIDQNDQLLVDVGVFEPQPTLATLPLERLQAQLAEGKNISLKKITEAYGLAERVPISVKPLQNEDFEIELTAEQVSLLKSWKLSLLDRLMVLGASKEEIEVTLDRTRLTRDVIDIEKLGMFEYGLTCKLGTEAAGLISIIGRYMRNSVFVVFDANRNLD